MRQLTAADGVVPVRWDCITGSEWVCFEDSSHMPHVEERERWLEVVGGFLRQVDGG